MKGYTLCHAARKAPSMICRVNEAKTLQKTEDVQIDLRFGNEEEGGMAVVVAPVLRFLDVGFNSDVRIQELGSPEKLISGFGPELFGGPIQVDLKLGQKGTSRLQLKSNTLASIKSFASSLQQRVFHRIGHSGDGCQMLNDLVRQDGCGSVTI